MTSVSNNTIAETKNDEDTPANMTKRSFVRGILVGAFSTAAAFLVIANSPLGGDEESAPAPQIMTDKKQTVEALALKAMLEQKEYSYTQNYRLADGTKAQIASVEQESVAVMIVRDGEDRVLSASVFNKNESEPQTAGRPVSTTGKKPLQKKAPSP